MRRLGGSVGQARPETDLEKVSSLDGTARQQAGRREWEERLKAAERRDTVEGQGKEGGHSRHIELGVLWLVGGGIATAVSYGASDVGRTYFVFWGAMVWGAIEIVWGLARTLNE
jgi:hypothetical protein